MTRAALITLIFLVPGAAFAHGAGHLKGVVVAVDTKQVKLTTEDKKDELVAFDKDTRFENDGKAAAASAIVPGLRVVVHLKEGSKTATAALVKFVAATPVRVTVTVTDDGFVLKKAPPLKVGTPITLVVTREVDKTCAKDIVLKDFGLSVPLPLSKPVEVTFVPTKAGKVHFACAMDMVSGDLQVE